MSITKHQILIPRHQGIKIEIETRIQLFFMHSIAQNSKRNRRWSGDMKITKEKEKEIAIKAQ